MYGAYGLSSSLKMVRQTRLDTKSDFLLVDDGVLVLSPVSSPFPAAERPAPVVSSSVGGRRVVAIGDLGASAVLLGDGPRRVRDTLGLTILLSGV